MHKSLLLFALLLFYFNASAQDSAFLSHATNTLGEQLAQEKAYLHLAKTSYSFGDTIWYKAYVVVGAHHQLSALSGILYVELISPADTLVTRQIVHLTAGVGWGDIPMAQQLKQGVYRIRAYTKWMRNFGTDNFYEQKIRLGGMAPQVIAKQSETKPDVQFFPEGGELVAGVKIRVAFKAIGPNGLGVDVKGTIEDNSGNVITDITSRHLGMGEFVLIPESGKSYIAKINAGEETSFKVNLPPVKDAGYVMTVNNNDKDSIYIKVAVNDKTLKEKQHSPFYLLAQSNDKVYYAAEGKLEDPVFTGRVDKKRFPGGIARFTLFNNEGKPVAERIAYIEGNDTLKFKVTSSQSDYTSRQPVKISLQVNDENNKPASGTFSAAVINESLTGTDELSENTIVSNLLLTSDLRGNIEQPNYYFSNPNDRTRADLDLLMLTQGYRKVNWEKVLSDTSKTIKYMPERSLEIAGIITTSAGKPAPNGKITLLDNKANLFRDTTADEQGNYRFTNLYLSDTSVIVLRARKGNNSDNVKLQVTKPDYPAISKISTDTTISSDQQNPKNVLLYQQYQKQQKDFVTNGIKLREVKITGFKHKEPDLSRSANLRKGSADQVLMGDQIGDCIDLSDCLTGRVHFANIHLMTIIIDGNISGFGDDYLNAIVPSQIYSIEVLRSAYAKAIYGSSIRKDGALVITLKNGSEGSKENYATIIRGLTIVRFNGYTTARAFYSPKYVVNKTDIIRTKPQDVVFWKPNILTDKDGKISFEYNNNDTKGGYRLVIEGIDDDGNLGRAVYRYEVK
ncbi:MAG: TonB-dependent receptor [Sphingobacteriales bacterium]